MRYVHHNSLIECETEVLVKRVVNEYAPLTDMTNILPDDAKTGEVIKSEVVDILFYCERCARNLSYCEIEKVRT